MRNPVGEEVRAPQDLGCLSMRLSANGKRRVPSGPDTSQGDDLKKEKCDKIGDRGPAKWTSER